MSSNQGFGKPKTPPKVSQRSAKRADAAQQLDKMKAEGLPEYEVYVRVKDKKQWFPVGAIAVKRSSQIHQAIYANQDELLQGAFRLFPILRKNQANLEYGYRLKEFKDDPIEVAIEPTGPSMAGLSATLSQLKDRVSGLFQRK